VFRPFLLHRAYRQHRSPLVRPSARACPRLHSKTASSAPGIRRRNANEARGDCQRATDQRLVPSQERGSHCQGLGQVNYAGKEASPRTRLC
jgi:hypothetical protein